MTLSWGIVGAVLLGALLHALWNAFVKGGADKPLDAALINAGAALIGLPFALLLGPPAASSWPFLAGSLVIHIGYYVALTGAYHHGELGTTYPIMRGFAPLIVALGSGVVVGETPSPAAFGAIAAITTGVALVGLAHPGEALHHGKALAYAFTNAAIIAAYTFVDGLGVRQSGDVMRYIAWLFVLDGLPYLLLLAWWRGAAGRRAMWAGAKRRWRLVVLGGAASAASYGIALWAMTRAPVASVAALRETSVLFAALLASVMLRERFGPLRLAGTLVIVGGVIALRLA